MEYKQIGNTGLAIPPVIFGTSALGNLYTALDFEVKKQIVSECFQYLPGNVVFDSAGKYGAGLALEMLGKCLESLGKTSNDVIISNKLGWYRTPLTTPEPTFESGVWMDLKNDAIQKMGYNEIIECWEQGNNLIGKQFAPQLISVHDPDEYINTGKTEKEKEQLFENILQSYKALADLRDQGKVKAIGVGAKNWKVIQKIASHVKLDWVMFANSFTIKNHPTDLLAFMQELKSKNVSIINSAVFHAGFLIGGQFYDYKLIKPDSDENIALFKWRESFFDVCTLFNIKPAVACIQFAMTPPGVCSIALNTSNPKNVKQNVESVTAQIPTDFWVEMLKRGLIDKSYPCLNI
jgi:D-threo-aldose 1-dehydrogenase